MQALGNTYLKKFRFIELTSLILNGHAEVQKSAFVK